MDVKTSFLERQARIDVTPDDFTEVESIDSNSIIIYFGDYFRRCDLVVELARSHIPGLIEGLTQLLGPAPQAEACEVGQKDSTKEG